MRRTKLSAVSAPGWRTTRFTNRRISPPPLAEEGTQQLVNAVGSVRLYPVRHLRNVLPRLALLQQPRVVRDDAGVLYLTERHEGSVAAGQRRRRASCS